MRAKILLSAWRVSLARSHVISICECVATRTRTPNRICSNVSDETNMFRPVDDGDTENEKMILSIERNGMSTLVMERGVVAMRKKTSFKNSIPRMLEVKYSSTQHMDTMCTLSHSANRSADQRTNEISASSCSLCVFCIVSLTQRTVDVCSFYPWICMIWSQPKLQPAATLFPLHHISHSHTNVFIGDFFSVFDLLFVYFILLCGAVPSFLLRM